MDVHCWFPLGNPLPDKEQNLEILYKNVNCGKLLAGIYLLGSIILAKDLPFIRDTK